MSRKQIDFPCPGRLKSGGDITILGRTNVGGIKAFRVKDTDKQERTYAEDKVIVRG